MSLGSRLKSLWSACFPQPTPVCALYSALAQRPLRRVLEIGLGDGSRALQIIKLARKRRRAAEVHYIGVDLFELRPREEIRLTLKSAYRELRAAGARVKLIPGDPLSALARTANSINQIDTVIIAHDVETQSLSRAWFYLPRMLTPGAVVFWADDPAQPDEYRALPQSEIYQRSAARREQPRRRLAA